MVKSAGYLTKHVMTVPLGKHRFPSVHRSYALLNGIHIWMGDQIQSAAEIFWVNQQGALEKQLDPGR